MRFGVRCQVSGVSRGFTIVETLVVVGIFALISVLLMSVFLNFNDFFKAHEASVDVVRAARELTGEIELAALNAGTVLESRSFTSGVFSTGTSTLVLELPSMDANGNIVTGAFDYVTIFASGTEAYRILEAHPSSARKGGTRMFRNLDTLAFTYNSSTTPLISSVEADVRFRAEEEGREVVSNLLQTIYLRNKAPL